MLQWVTKRQWLPEISFTLLLAAVGFLVDWLIGSWYAGLVSATVGLSAFFFRKFSYLASVFIAAGALASLPLQMPPLVGSALIPVSICLLAIFAPRRWSLLAVGTGVAVGLIVMAHAAFTLPLLTPVYGIAIGNETGRWAMFVLRSTTVLGVNAAAWFLGGFIAERAQLSGVSRERDAVIAIQARSALDIAEQNERLRIARDNNDILLQQVSGIMSLTDGARYAAKADPEAASRMLDRLNSLLRNLHAEMRRLYDTLNGSLRVAQAPPGISDLDALAIKIRELGYNMSVKHLGARATLVPSAELNIYRIVFEAVENVRDHAPLGSDIDVTFTWNEQGLQVLVKDNGQEVANRSAASATGEAPRGYSVSDDVSALTREADGPTITGMRERAALFQGSIEAKDVPGVGFTVSAIFPGIYAFASEAAL